MSIRLSFSRWHTLVMFIFILITVFFFKQKTAYEMRISDWSSDVCSSDLGPVPQQPGVAGGAGQRLLDLLQGRPGAGMEPRHRLPEIGRASCRERVCQYV